MNIKIYGNINPFSSRTLFFIAVIDALANLAVVLALYFCDRDSTCGQYAWSSKIWGPPGGVVFCEKDHFNSLLLEKANSLSNFGYIFFGVLTLPFGISDLIRRNWSPETWGKGCDNHLTRNGFLSIIYGLTLVYVGIGSFFFHAHETSVSYGHDQGSVFLQLILLNVYFLLALFPLHLDKKVQVFLHLIAIIAVGVSDGFVMHFTLNTQKISAEFALKIYESLVQSVAGVIAVNFFLRVNFAKFFGKSSKCHRGVNYARQFHLLWGVLALVSFLVGYLIQEQQLDVPCYPNSAFQFHALWHVLTAVGFFFVYCYMRSEHVLTPITGDESTANPMINDVNEISKPGPNDDAIDEKLSEV